MTRIPWTGLVAISLLLATLIALLVLERSDSRRPVEPTDDRAINPAISQIGRSIETPPATATESPRLYSSDPPQQSSDDSATNDKESDPVWTEYYRLGEQLIPTTFADGASTLRLSPDDIVNLIKGNVAPDSWSETGRSIEIRGDMLVVAQSESAHREMSSFLDLLREGRVPPVIHVETRIGSVVNDLLQDAVFEPRPIGEDKDVSYTIISLDRAKDVSRNMRPVCAPTLRNWNGASTQMSVLGQLAYIRDYDEQGPVIDVLNYGIQVGVLPMYLRQSNSLRLKVDVVSSALHDIASVPVTRNGETVVVERPNVAQQRVRGSLAVPPGSVALLTGFGLSSEDNRRVVMLISPTIVSALSEEQ